MKAHWLRRLIRLELLFIFMVILAGSVVRMTGSGMGCPDWPKCFGYIIPPTEESEVLWAPHREYGKGQIIVHDEALYSAAEDFISSEEYNSEHWVKYTKHDYAIFNPIHTWVEYVNRLFGALSGVPMTLLFVITLLSVRTKPGQFALSAIGLFLLGFEAWLGKEVVDGNLIPGQITYHMLGAFAIVMVLVYFLSQLSESTSEKSKYDKWFGPILLLLMVQTVLGTQVREQVDALTHQYGYEANRAGWLDEMSVLIYVHRSLSLLVSGVIVFVWYRLKRAGKRYAFLNATFAMVLMSTFSGALLFYMDFPKVLQPVHLMLTAGMVATLTWGIVRKKLKEPA